MPLGCDMKTAQVTLFSLVLWNYHSVCITIYIHSEMFSKALGYINMIYCFTNIAVRFLLKFKNNW